MTRLTITLEDLETFVAIAKLGSFTLAAELLDVSQPTVTSRIKKIEEQFGTRLFLRTTRAVVPTVGGERLLEYAETALSGLKSLQAELRDEFALKKGIVTVSASPTIAAVVLPNIVHRFTQLNPGILVRIRDESLGQAMNSLAEGQVDFAVAGRQDEYFNFDFSPMFKSEFYAIVPRSHALASSHHIGFEALAGQRLITMPAHTSIWRTLAAELEKRGLPFLPAYEAFSAFTLLGMVDAGLGITLLPSHVLALVDMNKFAALRVGAHELLREIGIVQQRGVPLSPAAEGLGRFIRQWVRAQMAMPNSLYLPLA